jgi:hypothetical protein
MNIGRLGFGCVVDNYGEKIYVVGGTIGKLNATDGCEYYNVEANTWNELPKLP